MSLLNRTLKPLGFREETEFSRKKGFLWELYRAKITIAFVIHSVDPIQSLDRRGRSQRLVRSAHPTRNGGNENEKAILHAEYVFDDVYRRAIDSGEWVKRR